MSVRVRWGVNWFRSSLLCNRDAASIKREDLRISWRTCALVPAVVPAREDRKAGSPRFALFGSFPPPVFLVILECRLPTYSVTICAVWGLVQEAAG